MNFRQFHKLAVQLKQNYVQQLSKHLNKTSSKNWLQDDTDLCSSGNVNAYNLILKTVTHQQWRSKSVPVQPRPFMNALDSGMPGEIGNESRIIKRLARNRSLSIRPASNVDTVELATTSRVEKNFDDASEMKKKKIKLCKHKKRAQAAKFVSQFINREKFPELKLLVDNYCSKFTSMPLYETKFLSRSKCLSVRKYSTKKGKSDGHVKKIKQMMQNISILPNEADVGESAKMLKAADCAEEVVALNTIQDVEPELVEIKPSNYFADKETTESMLEEINNPLTMLVNCDESKTVIRQMKNKSCATSVTLDHDGSSVTNKTNPLKFGKRSFPQFKFPLPGKKTEEVEKAKPKPKLLDESVGVASENADKVLAAALPKASSQVNIANPKVDLPQEAEQQPNINNKDTQVTESNLDCAKLSKSENISVEDLHTEIEKLTNEIHDIKLEPKTAEQEPLELAFTPQPVNVKNEPHPKLDNRKIDHIKVLNSVDQLLNSIASAKPLNYRVMKASDLESQEIKPEATKEPDFPKQSVETAAINNNNNNNNSPKEFSKLAFSKARPVELEMIDPYPENKNEASAMKDPPMLSQNHPIEVLDIENIENEPPPTPGTLKPILETKKPEIIANFKSTNPTLDNIETEFIKNEPSEPDPIETSFVDHENVDHDAKPGALKLDFINVGDEAKGLTLKDSDVYNSKLDMSGLETAEDLENRIENLIKKLNEAEKMLLSQKIMQDQLKKEAAESEYPYSDNMEFVANIDEKELEKFASELQRVPDLKNVIFNIKVSEEPLLRKKTIVLAIDKAMLQRELERQNQKEEQRGKKLRGSKDEDFVQDAQPAVKSFNVKIPSQKFGIKHFSTYHHSTNSSTRILSKIPMNDLGESSLFIGGIPNKKNKVKQSVMKNIICKDLDAEGKQKRYSCKKKCPNPCGRCTTPNDIDSILKNSMPNRLAEKLKKQKKRVPNDLCSILKNAKQNPFGKSNPPDVDCQPKCNEKSSANTATVLPPKCKTNERRCCCPKCGKEKCSCGKGKACPACGKEDCVCDKCKLKNETNTISTHCSLCGKDGCNCSVDSGMKHPRELRCDAEAHASSENHIQTLMEPQIPTVRSVSNAPKSCCYMSHSISKKYRRSSKRRLANSVFSTDLALKRRKKRAQGWERHLSTSVPKAFELPSQTKVLESVGFYTYLHNLLPERLLSLNSAFRCHKDTILDVIQNTPNKLPPRNIPNDQKLPPKINDCPIEDGDINESFFTKRFWKIDLEKQLPQDSTDGGFKLKNLCEQLKQSYFCSKKRDPCNPCNPKSICEELIERAEEIKKENEENIRKSPVRVRKPKCDPPPKKEKGDNKKKSDSCKKPSKCNKQRPKSKSPVCKAPKLYPHKPGSKGGGGNCASSDPCKDIAKKMSQTKDICKKLEEEVNNMAKPKKVICSKKKKVDAGKKSPVCSKSKKDKSKCDPCEKYRKQDKKKSDSSGKKKDPCAKYRKEGGKKKSKKSDPCKKKSGTSIKKKDPCKKKSDPCVKKDDPCKKKSDPCVKKDDPCKKKSDPCLKKDDPCKKKSDPCAKYREEKKKGSKKDNPCPITKDNLCEVKKTKSDPCAKKKDDPCKKKSDPCLKKDDPCKKKSDPCLKKDDPCKKKSDPCLKKDDPCKKKSDPCLKKDDPCKKKSDPCLKKDDPCKKKSDPCLKKDDPCKKKSDPCLKKDDPCKKKSSSSIKKKKSSSSIKKSDPCKKKSSSSLKKSDPCKKKSSSSLKKSDPCKKKSSSSIKKSDLCKKKSGSSIKKSDPCKKKSGSSIKKSDPCKKKSGSSIKKWDPCKKKSDPCVKKDDPCKTGGAKKSDPCAKYREDKKKGSKKDDPCKKKSDPCMKKDEPCKKSSSDPCAKYREDKKKGSKKDDPCKKKSDPCMKKDDPCKKSSSDPCAKYREDKKKGSKKDDPCKKKSDPCMKKDDPCKKSSSDPCAKYREDKEKGKKKNPCPITKDNLCERRPASKQKDDPCKKKSSSSIKKSDPCKKKSDPCMKKKDPCKKKSDPCMKKEDPSKKKSKSKPKFPCKKIKKPKKKGTSAVCKKPVKSKDSKKKSDPCKKSKKTDPCAQKPDPCGKKTDPCKKAAKADDPCNQIKEILKKTSEICKKLEKEVEKMVQESQKNRCNLSKDKKSDVCSTNSGGKKSFSDLCKKPSTTDPCKKQGSSSDPCKKPGSPSNTPCKKASSATDSPCHSINEPCKTASKSDDPCARIKEVMESNKEVCERLKRDLKDIAKKSNERRRKLLSQQAVKSKQEKTNCEKKESVCTEPKLEESVCTKPKLEEESVCSKPKPEESVCSKPKLEEPICSKPKLEESVCSKPKLEESVCSKPKLEESVCSKPRSEEPICSKPKPEESICSKPKLEEESVCSKPKPEESVCAKPKPEESFCKKTDSCKDLAQKCPTSKIEEPKSDSPRKNILGKCVKKTKTQQLACRKGLSPKKVTPSKNKRRGPYVDLQPPKCKAAYPGPKPLKKWTMSSAKKMFVANRLGGCKPVPKPAENQNDFELECPEKKPWLTNKPVREQKKEPVVFQNKGYREPAIRGKQAYVKDAFNHICRKKIDRVVTCDKIKHSKCRFQFTRAPNPSCACAPHVRAFYVNKEKLAKEANKKIAHANSAIRSLPNLRKRLPDRATYLKIRDKLEKNKRNQSSSI